MSEAAEAVLKVLVIAVAIWGLGRMARGAKRRAAAWSLVALGAASYVNYGGFHTDGTPFHLWDQFHYVMGSKYYPELGYDGIYAALIAARREAVPAIPDPPRVRDLRTSRVVPAADLEPLVREVRARFSPERWAVFREDALRFSIRDELLLDHGYNPTPARTFVERIFTAWLPFRTRTMALFALIDFGLIGLAGWAVYRAFGRETLAAVALVFGLGYCSRYYWIGGAFLRQDWIAAVILAAAALGRGRAFLAGVALGYAAGARVFPVLFLVPLVVFAMRHFRDRIVAVPVGRFAAGFGAMAALLLVLGCLAGRGPGGWSEFAGRLRVHTSQTGPNAIGLRVILSATGDNLRGALVDPATLYEYSAIAADVAAAERRRWPLVALAVAGLVAMALFAAWRAADPVTALAAGVPLIFGATMASCYYGSLFVLLALVRPVRTARVFLLASALMFLTAGTVLALSLAGVIRLNGAAVYVPVSALLLGVLVVWLRPLVRPAEGTPERAG